MLVLRKCKWLGHRVPFELWYLIKTKEVSLELTCADIPTHDGTYMLNSCLRASHLHLNLWYLIKEY